VLGPDLLRGEVAGLTNLLGLNQAIETFLIVELHPQGYLDGTSGIHRAEVSGSGQERLAAGSGCRGGEHGTQARGNQQPGGAP
jgi:hypothetical protein